MGRHASRRRRTARRGAAQRARPPRARSCVRPTTSLAHAARGQHDRLREAARAKRAVRDDAEPAQPEQVRAARAPRGRSRRAARAAPAAAARRRPWRARERHRGVADRAQQRRRDVPSITLSATLPVKPSVTIDVGLARADREALDVADEVERRAAARRAPRGRPTTSSRALASAPRRWTAARRAGARPRARPRERRAHERELDEVLGPHLDVGADVEQQERRAGDRHGDRERRAVDAAGALDVEQRRRRAPRRSSRRRRARRPRPSATARAACTIEASGVERTARAGSAALAIETGASTTSTPSAHGAELARPGRRAGRAMPRCGGERGAARDLGAGRGRRRWRRPRP